MTGCPSKCRARGTRRSGPTCGPRPPAWTTCWGAGQRTDLLTRLASDDALEPHLRRLASHVHEMRTKDKVGTAAMLAVRLAKDLYDSENCAFSFSESSSEQEENQSSSCKTLSQS